MATEQQTADLREYLRILRARKYEVLVVALLVVVVAMLLTLRQTPIYQGEAKVLVRPVQTTGVIGVPARQDLNVETERQLVRSAAVATEVQRDLGGRVAIQHLLDNVRADVVPGTELIVIRYDDPVPATAAKAANSFASAYADFRGNQTASQFEASAKSLQDRIDGIEKQLDDIAAQLKVTRDEQLRDTLLNQRDSLVAEIGVLRERLIDIQSNIDLAQGSAQIVESAAVPASPVSPQKVRNGVLALLAGLVLGVAIAFLRERLDDRVKSRQEAERRLGVPVIAAVPKLPGWRRAEDAQLALQVDPKSPVSEAYRTLGTNVQYMASQRPMKVLMVTSALGGEGKTTTSANLAVVLAQSGKRVILVSADLRRPRIHRFFGLTNDVGLSNLLTTPSVQLSGVARDPGVPNLRVVDAGPVPNNPAELLGSRRAGEFVESLRDVADFVIIDTPPVLAVADASILAPLVDGTIFVMDASHSSRSAMEHARDQLTTAGANLIGAVYNNFDASQSAAYPYYYTYYYAYSDGEGRNGHGRRRLLRGLRRERVPAPADASFFGETPAAPD